MKYIVYILKCADGTLYTGWTNNIKKRIHAHNHLLSGAKYTRGRRPVELIYNECFKTKSSALRRENVIKKLNRQEKIKLVY